MEPGLDDLPAFHAADRQGFLMGFEDGSPVSSVSVVRYESGFGFLGFYIVRPDRRGRGIGLKTWNAGMAHLEGCTVGLDGVVDQQDNYRKSGFALAGRNVRHTGAPTPVSAAANGYDVRPVTANDMIAIAALDRACFPTERIDFIRDWVLPGEGIRRRSLLAVRDGAIHGFGTVRACGQGHKIGPLFADDRGAAEAIFDGLIATLPAGDHVALDTPEDNADAVALALAAGLAPVFETARMYRGPDPVLPLPRIFGVTTFELG